MISLKDGIRSLVRIDFQGRVHKHFRGTGADERCANEVRVLKMLEERECPYVPRLLEADLKENYIITTNCGKTAENTISKKKADLLFAELEESFGIRHDDPEPRNITYDGRMGRFCIIDFELAEVLPAPVDSDNKTTNITRLQWSSHSQQGRRHLTNQDSHICFLINKSGDKRMEPQGEEILPARAAFYGVSDGVGGNNGGEFASKLVLNGMKYRIEQNGNTSLKEEDFSNMLQETHETLNLRAKQNVHASKLSATFVGLLFQGEQIIWANVGDSRLYRYREGELTQLSKDHNFAFRKWKRGEMTEIQFRMHPRKNILFDSMGGGHPRISPITGSDTWKKGDRYILCSDGIIDGLNDKKLSYYLEEFKHPKLENTVENPYEEMCRSLVKKATSIAGDDDTTLIVMDLN